MQMRLPHGCGQPSAAHPSKGASPTEVIEAVLTRMEAWSRTFTPFARRRPDLARREAEAVEKAILDR